MGLRLGLETPGRAGRRRRLPRGGPGRGTTLPGKLLWKVDPGAVDALAARLPLARPRLRDERQDDHHPPRWRRASSAATAAWLGIARGANLLSGVASALLASDGAELGLFEVDEAALPEAIERTRPRAVLLTNLFRDQLDRYGELEVVAEAGAPRSRG